MGELLERAFTEQRLLDAWETVRDAAMADGEACPEVERFEAAAARHVSELARALADGTFEPRPVVRVEIPKTSGGVRSLAVPSLIDRIGNGRCLPSWIRSSIRCCCRGASHTGMDSAYAMPSPAWQRRAMLERLGWRGAILMTALTVFPAGRCCGGFGKS